jgi:hypothetical protein
MNRAWLTTLLLTPWIVCACDAKPQGDQPTTRSRLATTRPTRVAPEKSDPHAAFDAILRENARDERVDYLAIRDHHWRKLTAYLDELAEIDPSELTRNERLAHYINLYNATMIHAVCERLHAGYRTSDDEWRVFEERLVRLRGKSFSLNHLEHEIIRVLFDEPRIHVALVCGARSCPPILDRAYTTENLDRLLETSMLRFVRDRFRNQIEADRARLSQIFNWYKDDFGGNAGLREYLGRYAKRDLARAKIEFLEYSWELNITPSERRWIHVARAWTPLLRAPGGEEVGQVEAGQIFEVLEERGGHLQIRRPFGAGSAWVETKTTEPYPG